MAEKRLMLKSRDVALKRPIFLEEQGVKNEVVQKDKDESEKALEKEEKYEGEKALKKEEEKEVTIKDSEGSDK